MSRPKMPPQIVRLVLLTLAIIVTYVIARYLLTPASFKQYGFYRGEALLEHMSHTTVFAGRKACLECHEDIQAKLLKDKHKSIGCETCHGVGKEHADNPDVKLLVAWQETGKWYVEAHNPSDKPVSAKLGANRGWTAFTFKESVMLPPGSSRIWTVREMSAATSARD